jgi:acetyl esterase/lipase
MVVAPVKPKRRPFFRKKWFLWPVGLLLTIVICIVLAFNLSPWPSALLIRYVFESGADDVKKEMQQFAPGGITELPDESYRPDDGDAKLDVYFPEASSAPGTYLPTLVWIHGGAWISGHKDDNPAYFQLIAAQGFTVVSIGYSIGPEKTYPTALHQINDALGFIQQQADRFHVDVNRIAIAGDSAGAQLTSQIATVITNPGYASELELTPTLKPDQLRAVVLFCGIYDMNAFKGHNVDDVKPSDSFLSKLLQWGVDSSLWAYTGERGGDADALREMSTIDFVTDTFPTTFISGGNDDPLTDEQSRPLASRLDSLGVSVQSLFYPDDYPAKLAHEYQFNLDTPDGQQALNQMLTFLKDQMS